MCVPCLPPPCRRYTEKTIGYAESHDQALVGDQTVGEEVACGAGPSMEGLGVVVRSMINGIIRWRERRRWRGRGGWRAIFVHDTALHCCWQACARGSSVPLLARTPAAFRLMGAEMYSGMSALQEPNEVVERGIALHKMIRTVTMVGGTLKRSEF